MAVGPFGRSRCGVPRRDRRGGRSGEECAVVELSPSGNGDAVGAGERASRRLVEHPFPDVAGESGTRPERARTGQRERGEVGVNEGGGSSNEGEARANEGGGSSNE